MPANFARLRAALKAFDWNEMFSELGWGRVRSRSVSIPVDGQTFTVTPVAELGGMVVYCCTTSSGMLPTLDLRRKIENQVKAIQFEHIIIFEDGMQRHAIFQWIKRGQGAAKSREFTIERTDRGELLRGELLLQRLVGIAFDFSDLDEEGKIGIQPVISKVNKSLDVESVTKRFYDEFTKQRNAFQDFLGGIPIDDDQRWYVSVMLNRLMFIYFIQSKQFLNNDGEYLQHKLQESQNRGANLFYREFLQALFFKGFAQPKNERDPDTNLLLGNVPYLNGGLFLPHIIEEKYGAAITIPDAAFVKLFAFFDKWRWHLNERPGLSQHEIDPDVLGYIFEKYINQKQMGAYYTKDDITGYICRNTIIPALFDKANLTLDLLDLPKNIEAYIYPAVKQVDRLPTETDREYAERQKRKEQIIADGEAGKIATINDAITANLNLEAMAFDLVPFLDARPLWSFYTALSTLSVLDPTCGSGAFLFAAIKILKPLYEQALDRMALLVERRQAQGFAFREILDAEQAHANRDYFITKSIIVRNLYGVDIMEEATEICKLRLFLRLVADLQDEDADHIEPLPDIDFNIRAGNALVGYATIDEIGGIVRRGGAANLSPRQQRLLQDVQNVQRELSAYRSTQLQLNPSSDTFRQTRQNIRDRLKQVNDALDQDLFKIGQIKQELNGSYNTSPFHWFTAFHEILENGGFDAIVGNPPYVEYTKVRGDRRVNGEDRYRIPGYKTENCGNLYAYISERCFNLSNNLGRIGLIVPLPSINTARMESLQALIKPSVEGIGRSLHVSAFDERPSSLFNGVDQRLVTELFGGVSTSPILATTGINRWASRERPNLFPTLRYTVQPKEVRHLTKSILKLQNENCEPRMLSLFYANQPLDKYRADTKTANILAYRTAGGRYWKVVLDHPFDSESLSNKVAYLEGLTGQQAVALVSSSTFWWYYSCHFDMYNLKDYMIFGFRFSEASQEILDALQQLGSRLVNSLYVNSTTETIVSKTRGQVTSRRYIASKSKPIIDEIDRVLAQHYGFTDEELDFIINYDIKYRMGKDAEEVEA
jgi:hypothetical protein